MCRAVFAFVWLLSSAVGQSLRARTTDIGKHDAEEEIQHGDEEYSHPSDGFAGRTPSRSLSSGYMVWDFSRTTTPQQVAGERANEMYGSSISIWDQYMVIGAEGDRSREKASGSVYVYSKEGSQGSYYWNFLEVLEPWDGGEDDNFGCSVDLHFYTLVVGANKHDEGGQDTGAAYIYEWYDNAHHHHHPHEEEDADNGVERMWYLNTKLQAEDAHPQDYFGSSVATQGNSTVVGAYGSDAVATFSGAVYVWRKTWTLRDPHHPWEWIYDEKIVPSDGHRYDYFGTSLAIYEDKLAVGAIGVDVDDIYKVGATYVYKNSYDDSTDDGFSYQLKKKLTPSYPSTYEHFGQSVALWDNNLIVGAPNSHVDNVLEAGAFYSYAFDKYDDPYLVEKVLPHDPAFEAHCGYSVDIYNDLASVGCSNASGYGSVYIYTEVSALTTPSTENAHWLYVAQKSNNAVGDMFGHAVSVFDDSVAVGAYGASSYLGSAYIYIGQKKVYQDQFEEVVEEDTEDETEVEKEENELKDTFLSLENRHPLETNLTILIIFLIVLLFVVSYDKRRKNLLRKQTADIDAPPQQYELAPMDSSHGGSLNVSVRNPLDESSRHGIASRKGLPSERILPASSRLASGGYTPRVPIHNNGDKPARDLSQRVRDLASAGIMSKPVQNRGSSSFATAPESPVFSSNMNHSPLHTPPMSEDPQQ